jgi:S-formylglutathione hydrolase FrmB
MPLAMANMASCKYINLNLCRGLQEDTESRTAFQYVASVGDKNVYRIFAGGDHSWVVIDDIIPVRS